MVADPKAVPLQRVVLVEGPGPDLKRTASPLQNRRTDEDLYKAPPPSMPIPAKVFVPRPPRLLKSANPPPPRRTVQPRNPKPRYAPPEKQTWRRQPPQGKG